MDLKTCNVKIDEAASGYKCPTCAWTSAKWLIAGGLTGVIVGGVMAIWAGK